MDADDGVAYYLAEWYLPELTDQSVDDIVGEARRRRGHRQR